jgi:hypothetical protein
MEARWCASGEFSAMDGGRRAMIVCWGRVVGGRNPPYVEGAERNPDAKILKDQALTSCLKR